VVQTTEADEFIYHEMLAHVPLFAIEEPKQALIIGGGDGGALREVLKHPLEGATMVELDPGVVQLSREHLPSLSAGAFEDPRAELIIGDGAKFLAETDRRFDLIIIDSTDPVGPGEVLFTEEFYRNCQRCLTDQGILITQNGVPFVQRSEFHKSRRIFETLFRVPNFYFAAVPTYALGDMAFGCASDGTDAANVPLDTLQARYRKAGIATRYYTPELHRAVFARPAYLLEEE
jgi:spermidine synthase